MVKKEVAVVHATVVRFTGESVHREAFFASTSVVKFRHTLGDERLEGVEILFEVVLTPNSCQLTKQLFTARRDVFVLADTLLESSLHRLPELGVDEFVTIACRR